MKTKILLFFVLIISGLMFADLAKATSTFSPNFYQGNIYDIKAERLSETSGEVEWSVYSDAEEECYFRYSTGAMPDSFDLNNYQKVSSQKACENTNDCEYRGQYYYQISLDGLESNKQYYYRILCTKNDTGGYYLTGNEKLYPYADPEEMQAKAGVIELSDDFLANLYGNFIYAKELPYKIWYMGFDGQKYDISDKNILSLITSLSVGVSNDDLDNFDIYTSENATKKYTDHNGKFLIQVEDKGRIWYITKEGLRAELIAEELIDIVKPLAKLVDIGDLNKIAVGKIPISKNVSFQTIKYQEPSRYQGLYIYEESNNNITGINVYIGNGWGYGINHGDTYIYYGANPKDKRYDGPYVFAYGLQVHNTGDNISYFADTSPADEEWCHYSKYGFQFVRNKIKNPHYSCGWDYQFFSYSPDGENYIMRNNKGENSIPEQFLVLSDLGNGGYYDYIDTLQWYDNNTFIYRAQLGDEWRLVINNKDQDIFDYIDNIEIVDNKIRFRARYDDGSWSEQEIMRENGVWTRTELERTYDDVGESEEFSQSNQTSEVAEVKKENIFKWLLRKLGLIK